MTKQFEVGDFFSYHLGFAILGVYLMASDIHKGFEEIWFFVKLETRSQVLQRNCISKASGLRVGHIHIWL